MIIDGLNEDIESLKREMEKIKELRLARIKSLEECAQKVTNVLLEQGKKVAELSEMLSLPAKTFESIKR
jgi:hypothetical protein